MHLSSFSELWVKENGEEGLLPGFTNFTQKQMFWIRYAHNFCGKPSQKILHKILEDSLLHAPDKYRLLGSIKLIPEFSEDFKCTKRSPMIYDKTCWKKITKGHSSGLNVDYTIILFVVLVITSLIFIFIIAFFTD